MNPETRALPWLSTATAWHALHTATQICAEQQGAARSVDLRHKGIFAGGSAFGRLQRRGGWKVDGVGIANDVGIRKLSIAMPLTASSVIATQIGASRGARYPWH